jgi:hypothetical protein
MRGRNQDELPIMRYLLLLIALLTTACQTNRFGEVPEQLGYRALAFGDVVRWGALEKMYVFGKPDADEPVKIPEGLHNVRVTSYELAQGLTEIKPMRWKQTAVIDYVLTDQQVVRQLIDHQFWVSDDGKIWYRENPPPQFH